MHATNTKQVVETANKILFLAETIKLILIKLRGKK